MNIKEYLILSHKNICKMDLNQDNSDIFLNLLTKKIIAGFNFFVISFSGLNDAFAFSVLKAARQILAECDSLCLISGRIDFAISLKADGIFLDDNHIKIDSFVEFLGDDFIISTPSKSSLVADVYLD